MMTFAKKEFAKIRSGDLFHCLSTVIYFKKNWNLIQKENEIKNVETSETIFWSIIGCIGYKMQNMHHNFYALCKFINRTCRYNEIVHNARQSILKVGLDLLHTA